MPEGYYRIVVTKLKALGFRYRSNAKGSHEIWMNGDGRAVLVPFNLKSRHTANGILKDAGSPDRV